MAICWAGRFTDRRIRLVEIAESRMFIIVLSTWSSRHVLGRDPYDAYGKVLNKCVSARRTFHAGAHFLTHDFVPPETPRSLFPPESEVPVCSGRSQASVHLRKNHGTRHTGTPVSGVIRSSGSRGTCGPGDNAPPRRACRAPRSWTPRRSSGSRSQNRGSRRSNVRSRNHTSAGGARYFRRDTNPPTRPS